jgi:hypothetical protein
VAGGGEFEPSAASGGSTQGSALAVKVKPIRSIL